jgi:glycosyltransferase involved in cell wall biosynthesis
MKRPAVAFVVEQTLGHITHANNLQRLLSDDPRIDAEFHPVRFDTDRRWRFVPGYYNWTIRAGIRARRVMRGVDRDPRIAATFVHTQTIATLLRKRSFRRPLVISLDATPQQYDQFGMHYGHRAQTRLAERAKWWVNRRQFLAAARLVCWSDWTMQSLIRDYKIPAEHVTVVPPGVDIDLWQRDEQRALRSGEVHVLFVGGDFERKGGIALLEAFSMARASLAERDEPIDLRLHVVTRSDVGSQEGVAVYHDVEPNSAQLIDLFHFADIFCLPTLADCLPMVLSEAFAAELPVISTRVGAIHEIVDHRRSGVLVAPNDASELCSALIDLAVDPVRRALMGREGRAMVEERFDAKANVELLIEILCGAATR